MLVLVLVQVLNTDTLCYLYQLVSEHCSAYINHNKQDYVGKLFLCTNVLADTSDLPQNK